MSISKAAVSILTSGALMAAVMPVASARIAPSKSGPSITASKERCQTLAGREETRCMTIQRRSSRLKLRNLDQHISGRGMTLREQRVIRTNNSQSDIREIGSQELKDLRTHDLGGGNTRRSLMERANAARNACSDLTGTEKYTCVREQMKAINQ